jgi:hypothetical protein
VPERTAGCMYQEIISPQNNSPNNGRFVRFHGGTHQFPLSTVSSGPSIVSFILRLRLGGSRPAPMFTEIAA